MADNDRDRVGTRLLVTTDDHGMVTMTMFNADGEVLGILSMDNETAQNFVDELDVELDGMTSSTLATMRCLGTA